MGRIPEAVMEAIAKKRGSAGGAPTNKAAACADHGACAHHSAAIMQAMNERDPKALARSMQIMHRHIAVQHPAGGEPDADEGTGAADDGDLDAG